MTFQTPENNREHEAVLDRFLDDHPQWQRWRTWSDETTHAVHESLCLRAELVHEPKLEPRWRFAVYASPVGARLWHAAASTTAPTDIIDALLRSLATHAAEYPHMDSPREDEALAEATRPLADSGWTTAPEAPGWVRWRTPNDAFFLRHDRTDDSSTDSSAAWVLSGLDQHRARWTIALSATAPSTALADVAAAVADCEAFSRQQAAARSCARNPAPPPGPHGRRTR
ncbi:DUF317 domain-containing protein [Streptomyces californicus]